MKMLYLTKDGEISKKDFSRASFCSLFKDLNTRDLRPVFSPLQVSTILPYEDLVIVNLGFLKCVLTSESVYFSVHNNEQEVRHIVGKLIKKIESNNKNSFVFIVLEVLFDAKILQFKTKVHSAESKVNKILKKIRNKLQSSDLEKLLILKKHLSKLETRTKEILSAIEDVLDDKEDLNKILSLTRNNQISRDALESILDNFLEQLEDLDGIIFRLDESIEDNEEFVNLTLNVRRTSFMQINLVTSLFTSILSILAVIVGLYGVNLTNGFESNPYAFYILSGALVFIFIFLSILLFFYIKKKNLY